MAQSSSCATMPLPSPSLAPLDSPEYSPVPSPEASPSASSEPLNSHHRTMHSMKPLELTTYGGQDTVPSDFSLNKGTPSQDSKVGQASVALSAHPKSSPISSVFVLAASTLGAGILALPYAFADLGYVFGTLLLVAVAFISSYSIGLLLRTARTVGATTYEDLGHAIFPTFGKRMVVSTTLVLIFGSLTAFFVIIADTLTPAIQDITGNTTSFFVKREVLLVIVALVAVFPLCTLRSIHALERWSVLAVGIIVAFSVLVVVESARKLKLVEGGLDSTGTTSDFTHNVKPFTFDIEVFTALPIICLAFTCQMVIFPIWSSLEGGAVNDVVSTERASISSMQTVVNRSLLLCGSLYLPVGLFGFFMFGLNTKSDVLNNFPTDEVFYDIVRILFTFAILIHYPIVHYGGRAAILTTWFADKTEEKNRPRFWIITCTAVLLSLILAIILPNLSTVFGLTGSITAFPYCFVFPTLFYLRLHTPDADILYLGADHDDDQNAAKVINPEQAVDAANGSELIQSPLSGLAVMLAVVEPRRAYHPVLTSSQLLGPVCTLPMSAKVPAYALLIVATLLWVTTTIFAFKDMIIEFRDNGI